MLTPELIQKMNQASGMNAPLDPTAPPSRASQILAIGKSASAPKELATPSTDPNTISAGGKPIVGGVAGGIIKGIGDAFNTGAKNVTQDIQNAPKLAKDAGNTLPAKIAATGATAGHIAGDVAGTVGGLFGAVISPFIPQDVKDRVSTGFLDSTNALGEKNSDTIARFSKLADAHPEMAKSLGDVVNTLTLKGGAVAEAPVKEAVTTGVEKGVAGAKDLAQGVVNKVSKIKTPVVEDLSSKAILDATPSYNKKLIGDPNVVLGDKTTMPRVTEGKGLKMRTVNPTQSEIDAGKELMTVEGYNPKATALDKYNTVQSDIVNKAKVLETQLKNENILRPPKEVANVIKKAIDSASKDSLVLQKSDPIVKNYMRVANRAIAQNDGTLSGELSVRKALDNAYEDAGGKYSNNKGLDQIHRAARNAINDDLEASAQSTQVKASLKQQSNLYRASDVLQDKARAEGGSKLEQFAKKHPVISGIGKKAANLAGLGETVKILTP